MLARRMKVRTSMTLMKRRTKSNSLLRAMQLLLVCIATDRFKKLTYTV